MSTAATTGRTARPPSPTFPTFFDNLDSFANAPEGVAKLRELILDLAVRGKLAEQGENDEPASVFLERLEERRAQLIADGELRRPREETRLNEHDVPFHLPRGWAWVKLGRTMQKTGAGSTPLGGKRIYVDDGVMFLRSQNVWNDGLRLDNVARIPPHIHDDMSGTHVMPGDVLLNITGASIGRCALVPDSIDQANVSQHVAILRLIDKSLRQFLHLCVVSPFFQATIMRVQVGVSREGLSMTRLKEFPVPVPPLSEQRRIVSKVDGLMSLCDELESRGTERVRLRERASRSCLERLVSSRSRRDLASAWQRLNDHFEVLCDTPETLAHLRQSILQLAIQGKLVPQDSNDEPAAELLGRISREVSDLVETSDIPKPKRLPPINDNGNCIPNGWQLIRSGELFTFVTSGSRGWAKYYSDVGPIFLRIGNLDYGTTQLDLTNIQRVSPPDTTETRRTSVQPNDILISVTGDTGMVGIIPPDFEQAHINQHIALTRPSQHVHPQYVAMFFTSPWALSHLHGAQRGIKNSLGLEDVRTVPMLLPPLAEQRRIVAKVDQLLSQCDELSARLRERRSTSQQLLTATIHHLLNSVQAGRT